MAIHFKYLLLAATRVPIDFRLLGDDLHEKILNKPFLHKQLRGKAAALAQLIFSLETTLNKLIQLGLEGGNVYRVISAYSVSLAVTCKKPFIGLS